MGNEDLHRRKADSWGLTRKTVVTVLGAIATTLIAGWAISIGQGAQAVGQMPKKLDSLLKLQAIHAEDSRVGMHEEVQYLCVIAAHDIKEEKRCALPFDALRP